MAEANRQYISIRPAENMIEISWGISILSKKEEGGRLSCYIPSFEIYYNADDKEKMVAKSKALVRILFNNFFLHEEKKSLKKFALHLHKLGFKAQNDLSTMHSLLNNKIVKANFKNFKNNKPLGFESSEELDLESTLELAV